MGRGTEYTSLRTDSLADSPKGGNWRNSTSTLHVVPSAEPIATSPWGIHWSKPASALCLLVISIGCAIGHHMFYLMKDGTEAEYQAWTTRVGTGLAYLLGFSLAAIVAISREQWVWRDLRTQFYTLNSIDAMFSVTFNITRFFNIDMLLSAKISTAMAVAKWLFPLLTIFTPSSISVVLQPNTTEFNCTVPYLDFGYDSPTPYSGGIKYYLHLVKYGTLDYLSPSPEASRIFMVPAFSGKSIPAGDMKPFEPMGEDKCNVSCSYSVEFKAPAVKCTSIDPTSIPVYPSWSFPECGSPLNNTELDVLLFQAGNFTGNAFWVLSTIPGEPDEYIACRKQQAYRCQTTVAHYSVKQDVQGGQFIEPTITSFNNLYTMESDYSSSGYNMSKHAGLSLYDTIFGTLGGILTRNSLANATENDWEKPPALYTSTKLASTTLAGRNGSITSSLGPDIEKMAQKMVISLLSDPYIYYSTNTTTNCTSTKMLKIYRYNSFILLVTYSTAIGVSGLIVILGIVALIKNGVASDTSFSTILRTSRNQTLDRELVGSCLGGSPLPKKLGNLKLRFGELHKDVYGESLGYKNGYMHDEAHHVAMGVEGKDVVSSLQKGGRYY